MADDGKKIVTKKTPVKAAAPAATAAKATPPKKAAAKASPKAVSAAAAPAAKPAAPAPVAKPAPRTAAKPAVANPAPAKPRVDAETRLAMIQEAAYYKAEARNFAPGFEAQDWADAEREVDARLGKAG
jgi:hypothetical protein